MSKLTDMVGRNDERISYSSKENFIFYLEAMYWLIIIGGFFSVILFNPEDFGIWVTVSLILIIIRYLLSKLF